LLLSAPAHLCCCNLSFQPLPIPVSALRLPYRLLHPQLQLMHLPTTGHLHVSRSSLLIRCCRLTAPRLLPRSFQLLLQHLNISTRLPLLLLQLLL
jgi:hypothetical protein